MMSEPSFYLTLAAAALGGLGMVTMAVLSGWRGWLALKHQQLAQAGGGNHSAADATVPNASARIEIADLKERIRKLEAIASGVDL